MKIIEANNFYALDQRKYILSDNKDFLYWFSEAITKGYKPFVKIEELQKLIDILQVWYEIKYPDAELNYYKGIVNTRFEGITKISLYMDFEQLLFRLPHNLVSVLDCGYRNYVNYVKRIDSNDVFTDLIIRIDYDTGKINKYRLEELGIITKEDLSVDEVIRKLDTIRNCQFDYQELIEAVDLHNTDVQLRKNVLQLAALRILYSKNTIPENGYERAKRFINEFNKKIPNLNLSCEEIDRIININYFVNNNTSNEFGLKNKTNVNYGLVKKLRSFWKNKY